MLFATCWLLAAAIAFAVAERGAAMSHAGAGRWRLRCAARRPAAAECVARRADPRRLHRLAVADLPAKRRPSCTSRRWSAFFALVQLVYYGVLGAKRQHPLQTIMIFDLGGISHFTKENQFPVDWSEPETAMLLNGCYQPTAVGHLLAARAVRFRDAQGRA